MEILLREDIPIQPDAFHEEILQSFPPKNNSLFDDNMRQEIYEKVDRAMVPTIVTSESVKIQIRRLFRNRQTGMDGCTVEHLLSVFNGGKGHEQLKRSLLEEYALFLQKFFLCYWTQPKCCKIHMFVRHLCLLIFALLFQIVKNTYFMLWG